MNQRLRFVVIFVLCFSFFSLYIVPSSLEDKAEAAVSSNFDPGQIISDSNFYDSSAMSEEEIQAFLELKVGNCRNSNCLAVYRQNTTNFSFSFGTCTAYPGGPNESAARIIFKVQKACGISAKVLLTTMQKEQSLISDPAPSDTKMRKALGQGCPDTAACDPTYASFFMQVFSAARQLAWYGNPNGPFTWIRVGEVRNIAFHPNSSCGSSPVRIKNKATAALYYYTPYQPNAAALSNLYGEGNSCSAYGNRNFWRIYSDWFGSPLGSPYINLDSIQPTWGGFNLKGWARGANDDSTQYIWVNVNGTGGPIAANKPLPWFSAYFPGYSNNHGFSDFISAPPGKHEVCLYFPNWVDCRFIVVPRGMGSFDSAVGVRGGVKIDGWSIDALSSSSSYIWVNVDGQGQAYETNVELQWLPLIAPGASSDQGFSMTIQAPPGNREVCVYGAEALLGCKMVTVPAGMGNLDRILSVQGGALVQGWFVDYTRTDFSYIWISVNGAPAKPFTTNQSLPWLAGYLPGAGIHHGYSHFLPLPRGSHRICVTGEKLQGCRNVTVTTQFPGSADIIESVDGGVRVSGWMINSLKQNEIAFPWVTIDGVGRSIRADKYLSWFPALFPEADNYHGFNEFISTKPGWYRVCVNSDVQLRCQVVNVTS